MKKSIIILFIAFLLVSCRTQIYNIERGVFQYKNNKYKKNKCELRLDKDSTFSLTFYYRLLDDGCVSTCNGRWKYIAKDTIFINCYPAPQTEAFTRCYMSDRERKIKVVNGNKLKLPIYNNVKHKYIYYILERVDSLQILE